jgi:Flp pilus assembly protein TadG
LVVVYRRSRVGRGLRSDDTGAIAILVAIFAVVMFAFAAIIVDLGVARTTSSQAQDSVDASALAAANVLYPGGGGSPDFAGAVAAAENYAASNYGTTPEEWLNCTDSAPLPVTPGATSCISFDEAAQPKKVRVRLPDSTVKSFFGGVVGYSGMTIAVAAQAAVAETTVDSPCAFCILGTGTHNSIDDGTLRVSGGHVRINGSLALGSGGVDLDATYSTFVQGTINRPGQVSSPQPGSAPVSDPLVSSVTNPPSGASSLPLRSAGSLCGPGPANGPGRYGAVTLSSGAACTLQPGLYVFTDPLTIGDRDLVTGAGGVTLVFTCGSGGNIATCGSDATPGTLRVTDTDAHVVLTAPTTSPPSGAVKGLALLFSPGNTASLLIAGGDTSSTITGTIYGPDATVDIQVPACLATNPLRSLVVVKELRLLSNTDCLRTSYVPAQNVTVTTSNSSGLVP